MSGVTSEILDYVEMLDIAEQDGILGLYDEVEDFGRWATLMSWVIDDAGTSHRHVVEKVPKLPGGFGLADVLSGAKVFEAMTRRDLEVYVPIPIRELGKGFLGAQLYVNETDTDLGSALVQPGTRIVALREIVDPGSEVGKRAAMSTVLVVDEVVIDLEALADFMADERGGLELDDTVVATLTHQAIVEELVARCPALGKSWVERQDLRETATAEQLLQARKSIADELVRVGAIEGGTLDLERISPVMLVMRAREFVEVMKGAGASE